MIVALWLWCTCSDGGGVDLSVVAARTQESYRKEEATFISLVEVN